MSKATIELPSDATLDRWSKELGKRRRKPDRNRRRFMVSMLYARYCRDVACCLPPASAVKSMALRKRKARRRARVNQSLLRAAAGLD